MVVVRIWGARSAVSWACGLRRCCWYVVSVVQMVGWSGSNGAIIATQFKSSCVIGATLTVSRPVRRS